MRKIDTALVTAAVRDMCIEAAHFLPKDVEKAISDARNAETAPLARGVLSSLCENVEIAKSDLIPICQDTGMAVVFAEIGQEVQLCGALLADAINEGVRLGYSDGYLRKSVVGDPLLRSNTHDNTPAVIHTEVVPGDKITLSLCPKGFGSENKSKLVMLTPADGVEGVKRVVLETVSAAGPNACPPFVVGVGIGGTFELAPLLAKKALLRPLGASSPKGHIAELERELLNAINSTGIGPAGLGGATTALAVHIESFPTHIAGLPVAVNMCCHVSRHSKREL